VPAAGTNLQHDHTPPDRNERREALGTTKTSEAMLHAGSRRSNVRDGFRRACTCCLLAAMAMGATMVALRSSSAAALLGRVPGVKITKEDVSVVAPLLPGRRVKHHGKGATGDERATLSDAADAPRRSIIGGALAGAGLATAQVLLSKRPAKSMDLMSAGNAELPLCPFLRKRILIDVRGEKEAEEIGSLPYARRVECGLDMDANVCVKSGIASGVVPPDKASGKDIVVFSGSGMRSRRFAEALRRMGYENVQARNYYALKTEYTNAHAVS